MISTCLRCAYKKVGDGSILCTVKKVCDFPVPSRDVTNQILTGELVSGIPAGKGKSLTFFYSVAGKQKDDPFLPG